MLDVTYQTSQLEVKNKPWNNQNRIFLDAVKDFHQEECFQVSSPCDKFPTRK